MHVAQFLEAFVFGPHVEVVEAFLPDVLRGVVEQAGLGWVASSPRLSQYAARKAKFERLHYCRRSLYLRFADQEVNVLGHDHVTDDHELIARAHLLQHSEQQVATVRRAEQRLLPITTTSDEMQVSSGVEAFQFPGHDRRVAAKGCWRGDGAHDPTVMKKCAAANQASRRPTSRKAREVGHPPPPVISVNVKKQTRVILSR